MVFLSGAILVALAGLALSEDKPAPEAPAKQDSAPKAQTPSSVTTAAAAAELPVIGYIEKRDRTITIKAGSKGTVYSVKAGDGKVLFENLSAEQLRAQAPELHEFIKSAVAEGCSGAGAPAPESKGMPVLNWRPWGGSSRDPEGCRGAHEQPDAAPLWSRRVLLLLTLVGAAPATPIATARRG